MTITVDWYNDDQTIVLYTFEGRWTWDELYPEYRKAIAMETAMPHRVDVILDMRRSGPLPVNVLSHVKNFADRQPENIGISVVVTTNSFVVSLYQAGCRFYSNIRRYFGVAKTMEEALAMIDEQRRLSQKDAAS